MVSDNSSRLFCEQIESAGRLIQDHFFSLNTNFLIVYVCMWF